MSPVTNGQVTGEAFTRLPHESTFSVAARIMWLNALPFGKFSKLCGVTSGRKDFWADDGRIDRHINRLMGWDNKEYPGTSDAKWLSASSPEVWFVGRLRLCPECMFGLYHSVWHQSKALERCPLHDCPLVKACWACGEEFGTYEFHGAILRTPYDCVHCGASLTAGSAPSIREHVKFRGSMNISGVFSPYLRQHRRAVRGMLPLAPFASSMNTHAIDGWWGTSTMIFQISRSVSTCALDQTLPEAGLSWLLWEDENVASGNAVDDAARKNANRRLDEADLVYMATLSDLKSWLTEAYGHLFPDEATPILVGDDGQLLRDVAPAPVMAYMLLRGAWEGDRPQSLRSPIGNARIIRWRSPAARIWPTTLNERGWEAVFRGTFAAFYWKLQHTRLAYAEFTAAAGFDTYFQYQLSPVLRISAIVFPKVEGLPLGHFDPPRMRLHDAMTLLRNVHHHNRKLDNDLRVLLNPDFDTYAAGSL
jgi:hypothetical protein